MPARSPVEFIRRILANNGWQRAGNCVQIETANGLALSATGTRLNINIFAPPKLPELFRYKYLRRVSGPASASGMLYDMDTNSSLANPSVFEYEVPAGETLELSRVNIEMLDGNMKNENFAGIAALTNGCLFQIIADDGITELLDFLDGIPIVRNVDFAPLSGIDSVVRTTGGGEGSLPVRFSIFKAGSEMLLTEGRRIRWTNRDNLSTISLFRMEAQATVQVS